MTDNPFPNNVSIHFTTTEGGVSLPPFATNNLGVHVEDNPEHVLHNRQQLQTRLSVNAIQWLNQVHGNEVLVVDGVTTQSAPDADASYTQQKNLACAVLTADCLPVLFAAKDGSQVAAAHAGWRGLADGVLLNTLNTFKQPSDVIVCFGVAISQPHFEVGAEVKDAFPWASDACFKPSAPNKHYAHLYRLAYEQLKHAGVIDIYQALFNELQPSKYSLKPFAQVAENEFPCTYAQEALFYSYRRDKQTGRQASLIWAN